MCSLSQLKYNGGIPTLFFCFSRYCLRNFLYFLNRCYRWYMGGRFFYLRYISLFYKSLSYSFITIYIYNCYYCTYRYGISFFK